MEVCASIGYLDFDTLMLQLKQLTMAEIRMDLLKLTDLQFIDVFRSHQNLIATCRATRSNNPLHLVENQSVTFQNKINNVLDARLNEQTVLSFGSYLSDNQRVTLYRLAIDAGCAYVDLSVDDGFAPDVLLYAKQKSCQVILSYHNYEHTPTLPELERLLDQMAAWGADVLKLACVARHAADAQRVLSLYKHRNPANLVAFCMGQLGRKSRFQSLKLGAPFAYAALDGAHQTASGQPTVAELRQFVEQIY